MAGLNLKKQKAFDQLQGIKPYKQPRDKKGRFTKNQEYYIWGYHQPNPEDFKSIKRKVDTPPPKPIPPKNTIVIDGTEWPTTTIALPEGGVRHWMCGSCGARKVEKNTVPNNLLTGYLAVGEGSMPDLPSELRMPLEGNIQEEYIKGQFDVVNKHQVIETRKGPITIWWSERSEAY